MLCISAPDFNSMSRKVMGRKWPNILPGEHLFIPTKEGIAKCVKDQVDILGTFSVNKLTLKSINMSYSLRYLLKHLNLGLIAGMAP